MLDRGRGKHAHRKLKRRRRRRKKVYWFNEARQGRTCSFVCLSWRLYGYDGGDRKRVSFGCFFEREEDEEVARGVGQRETKGERGDSQEQGLDKRE